MVFDIGIRALDWTMGSWAKLQLAQPPVHHIWLFVRMKHVGEFLWTSVDESKKQDRFLHCPTGLTMGSIVRAAQGVLTEYKDEISSGKWELCVCGSWDLDGQLRGFRSAVGDHVYVRLEE